MIPFNIYTQKLEDADFDSDPYLHLEPDAATAHMNLEPDQPLLPPKSRRYQGRATVVFDLDETLVYSRDGPLYGRPGLQALIAFTCLFFETVVWTAGTREYAEAVIRSIDPHGSIQHCVYRHDKWFREEGPKDLRRLGRDLDDVIMIENNPDCIRGNETNCVLVDDYEGPVEQDLTLFTVKELLEDLTLSRLPVPAFLPTSRHLRRRPADDADPSWLAYHIDPTALARPPWEWTLLPRISWVMHAVAVDVGALIASAPAAESGVPVADRWGSAGGAPQPVPAPALPVGRSGRRRRGRKGKARRKRSATGSGQSGGLLAKAWPLLQRPGLLRYLPGPMLREGAFPMKVLLGGLAALGRRLVAMVHP